MDVGPGDGRPSRPRAPNREAARHVAGEDQETLVRHAMDGSIRVSLLLPAAATLLLGCEVDNYLDPSRTGRFEMEPTTISILDRIDVIEGTERPWGKTSAVTPEDLLPAI